MADSPPLTPAKDPGPDERAEEIAPRLEAVPCRDLGGCLSGAWNSLQIYGGFYRRRNIRNQRPNQRPAVSFLFRRRCDCGCGRVADTIRLTHQDPPVNLFAAYPGPAIRVRPHAVALSPPLDIVSPP